jgi:hypothetical protein
VEYNKVRKLHRVNFKPIYKRHSSPHQHHGASRIVSRSCDPGQRLQARPAVARIVTDRHLSVVDPSCGSGHFVVAATREIASALAEVRTE